MLTRSCTNRWRWKRVAAEEKKETQIRTCLKRVEEILRHEMEFGTVTIIVQNGVPIQIDKTEKQRFS